MNEYDTWKKMVYEAIVSIAEIEFQKEAWLGNSPEVSSSFVETISMLFDDAFFVKFLRDDVWADLGLSRSLHKEMELLKQMIDSYNGPEAHADILSDVNWQAIVEQAKKVILMFDAER